MKRNARSAFNAIRKLDQDGARNVHLMEDNGWGAHFLIGCEVREPGDEPVGDYFREYMREYEDEDGVIQNAGGIRTVIHDILEPRGLYAEWINPGLIGVYDI